MAQADGKEPEDDPGFEPDKFAEIQARMKEREGKRAKPRQILEPTPVKPDGMKAKKEAIEKANKAQEKKIQDEYTKKKAVEKKKKKEQDAEISERLEEKMAETYEKRKAEDSKVSKKTGLGKHLNQTQAEIDRKYKEKIAKEGGLSTRKPEPKKTDQKRHKKRVSISEAMERTQAEIDRKYEERKAREGGISTRPEPVTDKKKADSGKAPAKKAAPKKSAKKKKKYKLCILEKKDSIWKCIEERDMNKLYTYCTKHPADLKKKDKLKNTVLLWAVKHDNLEAIQMLLPKMKMDQINHANFYGNTAVMQAVVLLSEGKQGALNPKILEELLSNPKKKPNLDHMNIYGRHTLIHACIHDKLDIVELLLQQDPIPAVNMVDKANKTALYYATAHNKIKIVQLLLNAGADFTITDQRGVSIEDIAEGREKADDEKKPINRRKIAALFRDVHRNDAILGLQRCHLNKRYTLEPGIIDIIVEFCYAEDLEELKRIQEAEAAAEAAKKKKKSGRGRGRGRGRRGGR